MRPCSVLYFPALAALVLTGCGRGQHPVGETAVPVKVPTVAVRLVTDVRRVELPGTVRAVERASLAPKVMGTVETLVVGLGQSVKRGDVLLKISANEIAARLAQTEAGLTQARRDLEREISLVAKGASPAETVRTMEDRLRLMDATVAEARTMLTYTTITAPFDGVITRRFVNEGDLAAPGNPLLEMENPSVQRVEVEVPDGLAAALVGAAAPVRVGAVELPGRIAEISPALDAVSRTFLAKIDLPTGAAVRSGQFARVSWPAGEGTALVVPATAVTNFGQMERTFVVAEGRVAMRLVKAGARHGAEVEILAGLAAGEHVVIDGAANLHDGPAVEATP